MILKYWEEVIVNFMTSTKFKRGLERIRVVSYQFGYQITLTYFKTRYHKLELEKDLFTDYPKDQNILIVAKVPFDNSLALSRCLGCLLSSYWYFALELSGQFP